MADFKFEAYDVDAQSSTIKEFSAVHLDTIINEFSYFLKGIGFEFDGTISLVENEYSGDDNG